MKYSHLPTTYLEGVNCCIDKKKIKEIRISKKLTITQVAKITGLAIGTVWKIESYKTGIQLCHFLRVAKVLEIENPFELLISDNSTITD